MGKATYDLKRKDSEQKEILIEAKNLKQYFRVRSDYIIRAVDDVSFGIREGEIMALVGETGMRKIHNSQNPGWNLSSHRWRTLLQGREAFG